MIPFRLDAQEKEEEEMREKVEGLRERVTREEAPPRRAALVGALVIIVIVVAVGGGLYYKFFYLPRATAAKELAAAKESKLNEIKTYFTGPLIDHPKRTELLSEVKRAKSPAETNIIDVKGSAARAWREYQKNLVPKKVDPYGRVLVVIDEELYLTTKPEALSIVDEATLNALKKMDIRTPETVGVPLILNRLQTAAGLVDTGDYVDVYVKVEEGVKPVVKGAKILAIMQMQTRGQIELTETEETVETAGGVEGKGTTETLPIGAETATLKGPFIGSTGLRTRKYTSTYSTNVIEVFKAAAAGKISFKEAQERLEDYGLVLTELERASKVGQFDVTYMLLLEVPKEKADELIQNMEKLTLTVPTSQAPTWIQQQL